MSQRGAGAPPPRRPSSGSGGSDKPIYYLSEPVTLSSGPSTKMVKALKLRPGVKNQPILTLDNFSSMADGYSINIHMFNHRGTKDNIVVCPKTETDPRPCPVCEVLNKDPTWYVCLTGIDRNKYTFERKVNGKMVTNTYADLRRLILVTHTWINKMDTTCERAGNWRGAMWEVTRSAPVEDNRGPEKRLSFKDSPRIGDTWYFIKTLSEEQMKSELEKAAANYGIPVERFIQPFNYEKLLAPKSHQVLLQIANDIRQDGSSLKQPVEQMEVENDAEAEVSY